MQTLKYILLLLFLHLHLYANAKSPYIVYNTSRGVVLLSSKYGEIVNPVRGTEVFDVDHFKLNDDRFVVKIKDTKSGEVYSYSGKGTVSPRDIISVQRYSLFNKFISFFSFQAKESGFNTAPVYTSQCVTDKGPKEQLNNDSISHNIATIINKAIANNSYANVVDVTKNYSSDKETFYYSVQNNDSTDYYFVIYTIGEDGIVNKHNRIILQESGQYRSDEIAFIPLKRQTTLDLLYFTMDATDEEDNRTCYIIIFNPLNYFRKQDNGRYANNINWNIITKELIYQGNVNRVLQLE